VGVFGLGECGGGEPSPGADVAGASPVPAQMWRGRKTVVASSECSEGPTGRGYCEYSDPTRTGRFGQAAVVAECTERVPEAGGYYRVLETAGCCKVLDGYYRVLQGTTGCCKVLEGTGWVIRGT
jgi:hypothetical protein